MNKQALAFISMFTLVLMLSIYYVSLETEIAPVSSNADDIASVMLLMNEKNVEEKEKTTLQLKNTLSDPNTTEEKKKEVLLQLEQIEDDKTLEENLVSALNEKLFKSVVAIEDQIIKVTIFEQEKSYEKANEIMNVIYEKIKPNQSIELVFS